MILLHSPDNNGSRRRHELARLREGIAVSKEEGAWTGFNLRMLPDVQRLQRHKTGGERAQQHPPAVRNRRLKLLQQLKVSATTCTARYTNGWHAR